MSNPQIPSLQHKGWHSRGYIPHFDNPTLIQLITIRLADSMPAAKIAEWEEALKERRNAELWKKVEKYLDAGHGACCLRDQRAARLIEEQLFHFDGERYRLLAWVIMPNHVHALIETVELFPLAKIVHSWKSYSANQVNRALGKSGRLWQPEYFDRYVRNEKHLSSAMQYINENPVKAGLVMIAELWPFSSASATY